MASVIRGNDNFDSSDSGASTTYGDVGTYVFGFMISNTLTQGNTYSGSNIKPAGLFYYSSSLSDDTLNTNIGITKGGSALSGTWRAMGRADPYYNSNYQRSSLFVRIS